MEGEPIRTDEMILEEYLKDMEFVEEELKFSHEESIRRIRRRSHKENMRLVRAMTLETETRGMPLENIPDYVKEFDRRRAYEREMSSRVFKVLFGFEEELTPLELKQTDKYIEENPEEAFLWTGIINMVSCGQNDPRNIDQYYDMEVMRAYEQRKAKRTARNKKRRRRADNAVHDQIDRVADHSCN